MIEYGSNYSEATKSLWCYSKDEAINFNADISNDNNFKYFEYKSLLLRKTEADGTNGILRNAAISLPLKYLNNSWRLLKMSPINCEIGLKLKWTKCCVFSAAGVDNVNTNSNNIIFTIKDRKLL